MKLASIILLVISGTMAGWVAYERDWLLVTVFTLQALTNYMNFLTFSQLER